MKMGEDAREMRLRVMIDRLRDERDDARDQVAQLEARLRQVKTSLDVLAEHRWRRCGLCGVGFYGTGEACARHRGL